MVATSLEEQLKNALRENAELRKRDETKSRQISELKELLREASMDSLTGLPGRQQFENRVNEELSQHHHHPEHHVSIFVVDLDHLKQVNDTHGHPAGDRMIVEFTQLFKTLMREYDIVARMTRGDEFAALLPGENHEGAKMVRQRLLQKFEELKDSMLFFSGASIGVASTSEGLETFEELYAKADQDMYLHKEASRELLLVKKTA